MRRVASDEIAGFDRVSDGVDIRIACLHVSINSYAATMPHCKACLDGELILGSHSNANDYKLCRKCFVALFSRQGRRWIV